MTARGVRRGTHFESLRGPSGRVTRFRCLSCGHEEHLSRHINGTGDAWGASARAYGYMAAHVRETHPDLWPTNPEKT